MSGRTRLDAIRGRVAADSGPLKWQFYDCARDDITHLLHLLDLAAAMPEPVVHRSKPLPPWCAYCRWDSGHASDCPWLLLQSALQRWEEVTGE